MKKRRIFHIITISTLLFSRIFLAVLQTLHDLHYLTLPFETYGVSDLLSGILVIWILIIAYRGIRKEKSNEQFTTVNNWRIRKHQGRCWPSWNRCYLMSLNGLSPKYQKLIVSLLQELKTAGKTIVISSHHFEQLAPIVERVLLFSEEHTITGSYDRADWEHHPDIQQSFLSC